jgi:hypothetical protein
VDLRLKALFLSALFVGVKSEVVDARGRSSRSVGRWSPGLGGSGFLTCWNFCGVACWA